MKKRFFIPELDGLRFVAFLLVFIHHTNFTNFFLLNFFKSIGWLGVDIFFCLSAYLLTRLLCIEFGQTGSVNILNFFMRRILRIWPLYFSYVFIAILFSLYAGTLDKSWLRVIGLLSFTDNVLATTQGYNPIRFTGHLWTISYEEQFYILLPFLILFLARSSKRKGKYIFLTIIAVGFFIRLVFIFFNIRHPAIWVLPITHFESIIVGIFLGSKTNNLKFYGPSISFVILLLAVVAITVLPGTGITSPYLLLLYPCIGIASGSALTAALNSKGFVNKLLTSRVAVYLGKISFGLYVFHNCCFALTDYLLRMIRVSIEGLSTLISLLLTILMASLSYTILEKQFLTMKKRFTIIMSRPE